MLLGFLLGAVAVMVASCAALLAYEWRKKRDARRRRREKKEAMRSRRQALLTDGSGQPEYVPDGN